MRVKGQNRKTFGRNLFHFVPLIFLASCVTPAEPAWQGKVWVGDSVSQALVRSQASEALACSAPAFSGMICMSEVDFEALLAKLAFFRERGEP